VDGIEGPAITYVHPTFSPDGKLVLGGGANYAAKGFTTRNGLINIWEAATGNLVAALSTGAGEGTLQAAFSHDDKWLAVSGLGTPAGRAEVWDVEKGTLEASLGNSLVGGLVAFSPKGSLLAIAGNPGSGNDVIQLWDFSTGKLLSTLVSAANYGIGTLAFSKDGTSLAVGGAYLASGANQVSEGVLELWNVGSRKRTAQLSTKESLVLGVTFSPDGRSLMAAGQTQASSKAATVGSIEVWSLSSKKLETSLPLFAGTESVISVRFSEGKHLLYAITSGGPGSIQVLDTVNNRLLGYLTAPGYGYLGLSEDGSTAASGFFNLGLTVSKVPPLASGRIKSIDFNQTTIPEYSYITATVILAAPAPAGGLTLGIESSSSALEPIALPSVLTIPACKTSATFQIQSYSVDASTQVKVTVLSGLYSVSGSFTVVPPELDTFTVSPSTVIGGSSVTGIVSVSNLPGLYGAFVTISSDNSAVDANFFNVAGSSSTTCSITTHAVTTPQTATLTATLGNTKKTVTLTVNPPGPATRSPKSQVRRE